MHDTAVFAAVKTAETAFVWWVPGEDEEAKDDPAVRLPPPSASAEDSENGDDNGDRDDDDDGGDYIVAWEIYRYRHMPGREGPDEWHLKCKTLIEGSNVRSAVINDLASGCMYRFSVRAMYKRAAPSIASVPSEPILMEHSLPNGWIRSFDNVHTKLFYYSNIRTKESRWTRPDDDPFFIDDSIRLLFSRTEIDNLSALFKDLMRRFGSISTTTFKDHVCVHVGEFVTDGDLEGYFANFTRRKGEAARFIEIKKWGDIMSILAYMKLVRVRFELKEYRQRHRLRAWYASTFKKKPVSIADPPRNKKASSSWLPSVFRHATNLLGGKDYGSWVEKYDTYLKRSYWVEKVTEVARWDIPYEVRTYLSPRTAKAIDTVFDDYDVETLRQYFCMLDTEQRGNLSRDELMPVVSVLHLSWGTRSSRFLKRAMRAVDRMATGLLNFDEFCLLVFNIVSRGKKKGVWKLINYNYDYSSTVEALRSPPAAGAKRQRGLLSIRRRSTAVGATSDADIAQQKKLLDSLPRSTEDPLLTAIGLSVNASYRRWQMAFAALGRGRNAALSTDGDRRSVASASAASSKSSKGRKGWLWGRARSSHPPATTDDGHEEGDDEDDEDESEKGASCVAEFVLPGDKEKGLVHGGSCFCGCRKFTPHFVSDDACLLTRAQLPFADVDISCLHANLPLPPQVMMNFR